MKIFAINPPSPDKHIYIRDVNRSGRRSFERSIWPQTSLALILAMFPEDDVRVIDCIAERKSYDWLKEELKKERPDWVIFNAISSIFTSDMLTAFYAKSYGSKTICIGSHVSALADETRSRFPSVDFIVTGEPEQAIRNIIKGESKLQPSFCELPVPRHDLLPRRMYRLPFIGKGYDFVFISRGCPYRCIYCRQAVTWKGRVQYRKITQIVEELKSYDLTNVIFHADTATLDKQFMMDLCKAIKPLNIRWCCNSRTNTIDSEMAIAMKDAGCWMVMVGFESGNGKVLELNRKNASVFNAVNAMNNLRIAGIKVWGYFMLGLYGDTERSMQQTIDFANYLKPDIANFSIATPYPGTEWFEIANREGWIKAHDWDEYDQNYSCIVDQPNCSADLVKKYVRKAYLTYYSNPKNLARFLTCGV